MRKHCRSRNRSRGRFVLSANTRMVRLFDYLQNPGKWNDWTFQTVSQAKAERMVDRGEAERIIRRDVDGVVKTVGFRRSKASPLVRRSKTSLTYDTLKAVTSYADGPRGLRRWERREVEKFVVWPLIGDTHAVAVRPPISDDQRKLANALFRGERLAA